MYQGYNAEIQRIVPRDRLLVFKVKDGWKPLCEFLGKEIPQSRFPKTNERALLARNIQIMKQITDAEIHKKMWRAAGIAVGVVAVCSGMLYTSLLGFW